MASFVLDLKDIIFIKYLVQGEIYNAAIYCQALKKIKRAVQNKRERMLTMEVCSMRLADPIRPTARSSSWTRSEETFRTTPDTEEEMKGSGEVGEGAGGNFFEEV